MNDTFKPTHISFDEGVAGINEALQRVGYKIDSRILTSRDEVAVKICNLLGVSHKELPKGFVKWQLPFYVKRGQFFITAAAPNSEIGEHAHDDDGVRFIVSGSVYFDGIELNAGDWMYIPKGTRYKLKVGPLGVSMCYCYECCCKGAGLNIHDDLIDPEYFVRGRASLQHR